MMQSLIRWIRRTPARWHAVFGAMFVVAFAAELFWLQGLNLTEYRLVDAFMRQHASEQHPDPDIVVVDIDDHSMVEMQEIAGLWSWSREIHADLLGALAEFGPRAILFDVTFSDRDLRRPKGDAILSDTIKVMPQVYLPAVRLNSSLDVNGVPLTELSKSFGLTQMNAANALAAIQLPNAIDKSNWRLGLINSIEDADGVLRRYRLYSDVHGWRLPSLPARLAKDLGVSLPTGSDFLMRWSGGLHRHYSYSELYKLLTERRPQLNAVDLRQLDSLFRNKVIVIGSSAASAFDHHVTPLGANLPGVDIVANAIDNLKNRRYVRIAPAGVPFIFGMLLIAAVALSFTRRLNPMAVAAALLGITALVLVIADAAVGHNLLLPLATPLIFTWAWFLFAGIGGYLRERRSREQAVSLFGRFLNPNVVRQIVDQGETVESLSGRNCNITVLFSDIRGFTTLSETRTPHEVVTLLNRYFERQVEVVFRHGGTLDKFIGDCIMAFWGAPVDDPEHAQHAVAAALEMQEVLLSFKKELEAEGSNVLDFDVGIGVHTGPAVVGFIGAQRKLDYTAIGDTVNLASRVEGLTKGVARVLVTQDTMLACQSSSKFSFESHGAFPVKGRAAAVELYEPRTH
ncbi:MAG TPA: adenylate/guanylate cyclase domain-containing protein [Burkholderiaceae bacterium]|jgi:adenylate cyclase